jgi:hypothetical protein
VIFSTIAIFVIDFELFFVDLTENMNKPTLKIGKKLSVEKWLHERILREKSD